MRTLKNITIKLIIDLIETDDDLAQEEKTDTQFSIMCKNKLRFIDKFIGKHSITESVISTNLQGSRNIPNVKLPKLEIKPFDGQLENWHEFWDSFNCTIHQSDICNVQKMTYLKNLVIGSAAATIAGFKLSNETQAVTLLHERYDNKQLQVSSHMNNLLLLQPITTLREVDALRDLYNKVETQIRSLENLGIDSTKYGPLLIPVLLSKIPDELNLIISRQFTNDCWDIVPVLNALKTELVAREKTSFSVEQHSDIEFTAASSYTSVNTKSRRNKNVAITTTPSCIFCNKGHKPHQCKTVTNIDASGGDPPNNKETSCQHVGSTSSNYSVLLQTAHVNIRNRNITSFARILFDNGSRQNFVIDYS